MKVALGVWQDRLSPLFDSSRRLLVVEIEGGTVTSKRYEPFHFTSPFSGARRLYHLGIEVLISGAISEFYAGMIEGYGIHVVSFVTGEVNKVLDAYLQNRLCPGDFRMSQWGQNRGAPRRTLDK
jgi:predicted Fe-Mo cluster-binding NifX family protein